MKNLLIALVGVMWLGTASCTFNFDDKSGNTGIEYTSAYICPMYCEGSGSSKAGNCPTCNMDYVKNEKENIKK